jgi:peptidoglycan/xylan/chitin deacetylase (PgdA/CDA1 family)
MPRREQSIFKRILKLLISMTYLFYVYLGDLIRIVGKKRHVKCIIVYYHSVTPENRLRFAEQMDVLSSLTIPIPADWRDVPHCGGPYAAVTFDDGYENLVDNALPELAKRGIPCAIFVIAYALGEVPDWEVEQQRLMTADQLMKLPADLVVIGSHTLTHPNLLEVDQKEAMRQIRGSRIALEELLKREVKLFSFPYGAFDADLVKQCRQAGYERVFTTLPEFALAEPTAFTIGRVSVEPTDWPLEYRLKLMGGYNWLPPVFSLKRKVLRVSFVNKILRRRSRDQQVKDSATCN